MLPPAASRVADELLRRYGLGASLDVQPAGAGLLNQNLIATTAGGTYFLKGYRYVEPAPLAREHGVIAFAAGAGLPAVVPLSAPGGQTFLRVGGRLWAVFPRVEDRQVGPAGLSPAHAGAMGRALGRVHLALARFPPTEATRYPPRLVWDSARAGAEMREYEEAIGRFPALTPFDQHALSSFAYRRTLLAAGVPPRAAFAGLPEQMLHGDFHEGNLFFGPDGEVSGVIDWELASVGPRALEIVRALDVSLRATGAAPGAAAAPAGLPARLRRRGPSDPGRVPGHARAVLGLPGAQPVALRGALPRAGPRSQVRSPGSEGAAAPTDHLAMQDIPALEWWLRNRHEVGRRLIADLESAPRGTILTARS